jgi:serine/threonine protein phosphatase PrpC
MKIKKALEETFKLVSDTVADKLNYKSGCTAVVALFQERIKSNPEKETSMSEINENDVFDKESDKDTELEKIWFANCGDARAVSCRQDSAMYILLSF